MWRKSRYPSVAKVHPKLLEAIEAGTVSAVNSSIISRLPKDQHTQAQSLT
jgi:hypothetical protein